MELTLDFGELEEQPLDSPSDKKSEGVEVDFVDPGSTPLFENYPKSNPSKDNLNRRVVKLPSLDDIEGGDVVEKAIEEQRTVLPSRQDVRLPEELVEAAKATFVASGGNISEVAAVHDLTPEAVTRLAARHEWPVYGQGTTSIEKRNRSRLHTVHEKLWLRLENMLDAMGVEHKEKEDIVRYRKNSQYVESLSARNSAFKTLFDNWMRVGVMLYPEVYGNDPSYSNGNAISLRDDAHPDAIGGIEGVNREMADFLGRVVIGMADELRKREIPALHDKDVIDAEVLDE